MKPMDKKLYHRGNGEVVALQKDWAFEKNALAIETLAPSLPIYAYCDPSLPVGWIDGEEVYQVQSADKTYWGRCHKFVWIKANANVRRIWVELKTLKSNISEDDEKRFAEWCCVNGWIFWENFQGSRLQKPGNYWIKDNIDAQKPLPTTEELFEMFKKKSNG